MKLPSGWMLATTGTVCSSIVPGRDKPRSFSGNIAWVTLPDIVNRYVPSDKHILRLTPDEIQSVGARIVPEGSVIMSCVGEFGIVAINIAPVVINQQLHAFICSDSVVPAFLMYCLQVSLKQMQAFASTTTIPYLNKSNCESIPLLLPPRNEQEGITHLLSTWDTAIEKMERLLEAKEKLYSWLLKRLITSDKHPRRHIRDFTTEVSKRNSGGVIDRVLSVTNNRGFVLPEDQFERRVASSDLSNYKVVMRGQYAYNPSRINVGSIARLYSRDIGVLSPMYVVFRLNEKKVNNDFFLHWLSSHEAKERIGKSAQGSVRETVSFGDFGAIPFPIPPLEQQQQIATTLNIVRQEIDLLKKRVEAYSKQKCGLMQKLLTGQWRVKNGEEVENG